MPIKYIVTLTADERTELDKLVRTGTAPGCVRTHAQILLKADCGSQGPAWTDEAIKDALDVGSQTASLKRAWTPRCIDADRLVGESASCLMPREGSCCCRIGGYERSGGERSFAWTTRSPRGYPQADTRLHTPARNIGRAALCCVRYVVDCPPLRSTCSDPQPPGCRCSYHAQGYLHIANPPAIKNRPIEGRRRKPMLNGVMYATIARMPPITSHIAPASNWGTFRHSAIVVPAMQTSASKDNRARPLPAMAIATPRGISPLRTLPKLSWLGRMIRSIPVPSPPPISAAHFAVWLRMFLGFRMFISRRCTTHSLRGQSCQKLNRILRILLDNLPSCSRRG